MLLASREAQAEKLQTVLPQPRAYELRENVCNSVFQACVLHVLR